jgi:glycosyltransferase involved in cell wall biosynthesis
MAKLPISVCMISGAEAGRIGRALQSVSERAAEVIVVLNDEVRDGTDTLCEAQGAKVFREPWRGYVAQKNSAADKASSPWILSLDADEEVPPALWAEIAAMLDDPDKNRSYAAFEFPRCSWYCGRWIRHGDWYPDRVVRLWRKGSAAWKGIEIHERLEVKGAVGRLQSDLLHYSNQSINGQLDKIGRYADPFVRHCLKIGRSAGWLDLTIRPVWKFLRAYFLRLGFLDGWPGYYIAWLGAFSTVTRYAKVREARLQSAP